MADVVTVRAAEGRDGAGTGPAGEAPNLRVVFGGLMLVLLLASLDSTIVATALPTIVGELGGIDHLSWVVTAYLLAQTVVTPLYGKLGDLYGRKRVLQSAIVLFLVGSALCGLAGSMFALIAFRALQGFGGGGLAVGAQAAVGDVIPPRDRGRYQGIFGAVFGVSSVAGPLLGGWFTTHLSWRWIFYVNLPFGILALVVLGATLPSSGERKKHRIDYAGAALLAVALAAIVLLTDLGGTTFPWASPEIVGLGLLAVVGLAAFVAAERRAAEPVLPLHLFANRVFSVTSGVGLIVGFAMFGSITFLPLFLQTVKGASPTSSGLQLVPVMGGMLVTSIASGQLISRWGKYRVFPIVGTAVMAVGLWLLSTIRVDTGLATASLYMLVLGAGLGMVMQVLVIAVQNSVDYADLGVATSGATLFRSIGGSLGTAVLGAVFTARLGAELASALGARAAAMGGHLGDPAAIRRLPPATLAAFMHAFTAALDHLFVVAMAVATVAFVLAWLIPHRPLRQSVAESGAGVGESFAMPTDDESWTQLSRIVWTVLHRPAKVALLTTVAERAGVELPPAACWLLARAGQGADVAPERVAHQFAIDPGRLRAGVGVLRDRALLGADDRPTERGEEVLERLRAAGREWMCERLEAWRPDDHEELRRYLDGLAWELVAGEV